MYSGVRYLCCVGAVADGNVTRRLHVGYTSVTRRLHVGYTFVTRSLHVGYTVVPAAVMRREHPLCSHCSAGGVRVVQLRFLVLVEPVSIFAFVVVVGDGGLFVVVVGRGGDARGADSSSTRFLLPLAAAAAARPLPLVFA
jgi:hypothetical protein